MRREYTEQAAHVMETAFVTAREFKQSFVSSEYVLVGLLYEEGSVAAQILQAVPVQLSDIMKLIWELSLPNSDPKAGSHVQLTPEAERLVESAEEISLRYESDKVGTEHLLQAILENRSNSACKILYALGADVGGMYLDLMTACGRANDLTKEQKKEIRSGHFESKEKQPMLDQFTTDLTERAAAGDLDPLIGREQELMRMMNVLARRGKNNPCLIGEPGVGKTAIVEGLAQRIADGVVPEQMHGKRILTLDLSAMVAGTKYRGEFEERIKGVIDEVSASRNIILFVDEIHTLIGAGGAEGALDAANILKPALSRGQLQMIGATTIDEYRKNIEKDAALERRFQPVTVEEPTVDETLEILDGLRARYEAHHRVEIADDAVAASARLSERYINDRFLPDKAIDLLDEACARIRLKGSLSSERMRSYKEQIQTCEEEMEQALIDGELDAASESLRQKSELNRLYENEVARYQRNQNRRQPIVTEADIADTVSEWTGVPLRQITESEAGRLQRLEKTLHRRVIAQEEAVDAVARAVRRGRVGLKDPNRPIGSFLFLGPTGVGKTEISKALAEAVFGTEDAMIRVDMSEYMEKHSVSKMIGSPPGYVGYDEGGQLSEKVRRKPYSVLLFDEIEKAHPDVFNILLQVLDEGHITDAQGRRVDFKNTIIIMTSNAGAQQIVEPKKLGFSSGDSKEDDYKRMKDQVMAEVKRIFKPEFLNRIDETIVFHVLSPNDMKKIVGLQTRSLQKRCAEKLSISLKIRDSAKKLLVEQSYDPQYGARPLRRKIQTDIEDVLAERILSGEIRAGDAVDVAAKKGEIVFLRKEQEKAQV